MKNLGPVNPKMNSKLYNKIEKLDYEEVKQLKYLVINNVMKIITEDIDYISDTALDRILKNLNNVKIYKKRIGTIVSGEYKTKENIMVLNNLKSLNHECLHLMSSEYDPNIDTSYSGFRVTNHSKPAYKINDRGMGFNEGYTQYCALKLGDQTNIYTYESKIAARLERIIGVDILRPLYYEHNLPKLIEEIEKRIGYEETNNIISGLDYLVYCRSSIYLQYERSREITEKKKMINYSIKRI